MTPGTLADTWQLTQEKAKAAIAEHFPVETPTRRLELHSVTIDDSGADFEDLRSQEAAKQSKKTWGAPVTAEISLFDKQLGKRLDKTKIKLFTLPKPTNRYSYIVDGSEWQVDNLWRLRSGVYSHIKQNGQLESQFNLAKPFAKESRLYIPFDPDKKTFKFKYGTLNVPLYSMLKMLGVNDEQMKKEWGPEVYEANVSAKPEKNIIDFYDKKLNKRGVRAEGKDYESIAAAITEEFGRAKLLPDTTKAALGKPFEHVNGEAMLLASAKLLKVTRGEAAPEDRDSLIFKALHGVDDFVHGKLTNPKVQRSVRMKIGNNINRLTKVREIIPAELFGKPVREVFTQSSLSKNPEQINPLEMISSHRATTIMASEEGGIKKEHAVTMEMKGINPSHMGFLDPILTPEGEHTGITLHLPIGVKKVGNEARTLVYDLKNKKFDHIGPTELHSNNVLLPDQVTWDKDGVPKPIAANVKMKDPETHDIVEKPFAQARYTFVHPHQLFAEATNLIPFLQNNQGNRTMMASRQSMQAVSLAQRELPLVQVRSSGDKSWEEIVGGPWSHQSRVDGKVVEIRKNKENGAPDAIMVQDKAGAKHEHQVYNNFPLNDSKTYMHATPTVQVGDSVKKGGLLADTNFTKDGKLALGTNLRVGYMAYKGYNFNDGIVVSESAAKKLTSEHLHRHTIEIDPELDHLNKQKFLAYASASAKRITADQAHKIGDDGLIRVGQRVQTGDILAAAVGKPEMSNEAVRVLGRLDKRLYGLKDKSVTWDSDYPGEVTKVVRKPGGKGATVYVRTLEPLEVGDKIVGRQANKAIVTQILPDHEMPKVGGPEGQHLEVLMNPSGVPTRINLGQMLETSASKIALKTGKPYLVQNFGGPHIDYTRELQAELKQHGLSDTDPVYDPKSGKKIGDIMAGHQYIMKLKHQVEKKLAVRSHSQGYTLDHSPAGTGYGHPGQALDQLSFYALLAHGARHNLREMAAYKSDEQLDENYSQLAHTNFWNRVRMGMPLPAPKVPFAYKRFEHLLTGLGVNIRKDGNELQLTPLTDKGVLALSNGEIKDTGRVTRAKDAKELEKGLFDPKITGGLPNDVGKGTKWAHIALAEPVPNPIFVGKDRNHPGPAVVLSGLKFAEFEEVARGQKYIDGKTGGVAIEDILKKIDVKTELKKTRELLPKLKGNELDRANRKAKYLIALDQLKMKPAEAYITRYVPVMPPRFRPISVTHDGALHFADVNGMYHAIGLINNKLKTPVKELPDEENQDLRAQLYDAMKAMQGLGGKPVYESNRKLKGILDTIAGDQPKTGYFQEQLMKRRQDLSMRSTIIPDPQMHIDHIGMPKNAAMELYKPFVIRELQAMGAAPDPVQALKIVKANTPVAERALQRAMDKRPVLLKRDPVLHKYGIMAFKPKIVEGKAIQIHPLVTGGYNADFDGDSAVGPLLCCNMAPPAVASEQEENMPHTGPLASYQVIEIRDFPRLPETKIVKPSGVIEYDVPEQVYVPAYLNGQMKLMPAAKFSIHPDCEEWKVESLNGRELHVSSDHSLALLNPETLVVEKVPPRDSVGMLFPTMRSLDNPVTYSHLPGAVPAHGKSQPMLELVPLTKEAGWFIGATIGDGWVTQKKGAERTTDRALPASESRAVCFASGKEDQHFRVVWQNLALEYSQAAGAHIAVSDHEFDGSQCTSIKTTISSTALGLWLEPMIGKGARNKHLPLRFLEMPLEFRQGLFCGLIDTDGSVNWNERGQFAMSFTTTSERLAGEMMLLALSLGLPCNRTEYQNREQPAYIISLSIRPVQDATWIKLVAEKKSKALDELHHGKDRDYGRNDFVPLTGQAKPELIQMLRDVGATRRPPDRDARAFSLYVILMRSESKITRQTAQALWSIAQEHPDYTEYLSRWFRLVLDESVGWDIVMKAEPTGQRIEMYDLTVPESWTFTMANGAVVWDTMSAFVPLTTEAVEEAHKMFPSNNLFSSTTYGPMYVPEQEALLGLHLLSKWGKTTGKSFDNFEQLQQAKERGLVHPTDVVKVHGNPTTFGRLLIAKHLPDSFKTDPQFVASLQHPRFDIANHPSEKNPHRLGLTETLGKIAKTHPKDFPDIVNHLEAIGNNYAYELGHSISLNDLAVHKKERAEIFKKYDAEAEHAKGTKDHVERDRKLVDIYSRATTEMTDKLKGHYEGTGIYQMVESGARGKMDQFRQMNMAPMLVKDSTGRTVPTPIKKSYSEGLDVGDYWTSMHGARMGTIQKVTQTAEPGAMTKEIVNVVAPSMVVSHDCGTTSGIFLNIHDQDVHDRVLASPIKINGREVARAGAVVTPELTSLLKKHKVDQVVVRSPLKCQHGQGICAKCYGLNEDGKFHEVGTNIGVIAAQAFGEPATQLSMDCNAAGNFVTVQQSGKILTLTFAELWHRCPSLVTEEDGIEVKIPVGLEVWDHQQFVPVHMMQRHRPYSPMALVRLASGHAFIAQNTHPNWARPEICTCPRCGQSSPVQFVGHSGKSNTTVRCSACRKSFTIPRALYQQQQERVVPVEGLVGHYLGVGAAPTLEAALPMPLPPYLLGIFLSEGDVKRMRERRTLPTGRKRRIKCPSGLSWKILGVSLTQNQGAVRQRICTELRRAHFEFCQPSSKHLQLGNVQLARVLWSQCGIGSAHKQLPAGWRGQSLQWMRQFLAGLLDGDGTAVKNHTAALDTTSWALASQVQELVLRLGGTSTVYASTVRKLTRNQGYRVVLDLPEALPSVRQFEPRSVKVDRTAHSKVVQVKSIQFYTDWTYDLSTDSRGFSASGVRTHNSFHSGGVAASRGGRSMDKFTRLKQLLEVNKTLPNAAPLSKMSGPVQKVELDKATHGHNIWVGGERHYVQPHLDPLVKPGAEVKRGDPLSTGVVNPHELLRTTDIYRVQNYLTDELHNHIFKDERVRRRNIETVVRSLTNLTKVTDPGDSEHLIGDVALRTNIEEHNRSLKPGQDPIHHAPILRAAWQTALDQHEDWMARLNFQRLRQTVMEGTAKGWKTNLHGQNPFPAYAHAAEFGRGTPAKPHLY